MDKVKRTPKTSESTLRAIEKYNKKNGLIVIGCKVTSGQKELIVHEIKKKGYASVNAYLKKLIENDLGIEL